MASGNPNTEGEAGPSSPTGLLPLNAFGGKIPEPGDVCKFRVVQVYGDQAEVEYVKHEESPVQPADMPAETPESEMNAYMS